MVYLEEVPLQAFPMFQGTTQTVSSILTEVLQLCFWFNASPYSFPGKIKYVAREWGFFEYAIHTIVLFSELTGHQIERFIIWNFEYGKDYSGPE